MRMRALLFAFVLAAEAPAAEVLWRDNDDLPVPEPAEDDLGNYKWWHDAQSLSFYQAGKMLDLGTAARTLGTWTGLVGPREAANVNALDEVPDSTWFENRHPLRPLTPEEAARPPGGSRPPAEDGPLTVVSGKTQGEAPGVLVEDAKGDRYLLKFDPEGFAGLGTGAEQVSARIVHALGWHVPGYHLVVFDPARLELAPDATTEDSYNRKRSMRREDLEEVLARVAKRKDGRLRASASRILPGIPKGPFRMEGMRPDDPNDTIPHEDRRDLRGFRVVAAFINHTDFRPANTLDTFVTGPDDPHGHGRLVHHLLDFGSTLGSADLEWKKPRLGSEYHIDPPVIAGSFASLGFWVKDWEDERLLHPTVGFLSTLAFDPASWVPEFPNPAFEHATERDLFWGAKLVTSLGDEHLRAIVAAAEWDDPAAEAALVDALAVRRDRIAATWLDGSRINPADRFAVRGKTLGFVDLAVATGVRPAGETRYRYRVIDGEWQETSRSEVPLPGEAVTVELESRRDDGWGPATTIEIRGGEVVAVDREVDG